VFRRWCCCIEEQGPCHSGRGPLKTALTVPSFETKLKPKKRRALPVGSVQLYDYMVVFNQEPRVPHHPGFGFTLKGQYLRWAGGWRLSVRLTIPLGSPTRNQLGDNSTFFEAEMIRFHVSFSNAINFHKLYACCNSLQTCRIFLQSENETCQAFFSAFSKNR